MAAAQVGKKNRLLIGLLAVVAVAGLLLIPTLKRSWLEAQRINRTLDRREAELNSQRQKQTELETAQAQVLQNPKDADAHLRLAALLGQARQYTEAIKYLAAASRLAPKRAEPHLAMAEVYQSNSVFDMTLEEQRAAVALEPDNVQALASLGYTYISLDWNMAAFNHLKKAIARFPNDPTLKTVMSLTLYQMRDYRGALAEIMDAKKLAPDNHRLDGPLIDIYNQLEQHARAEEAASAALKNDPNNVAIYVSKSRAQRSMGRLDAAEASARQAVNINPEGLNALYELALVQKKRGKSKEAQGLLEGIVEKNPLYEQASVLLGQIYSAQGRPQDTTRVMEVYNRSLPESQSRVQLSLKVGNEPDNAAAHFEFGKALLETRRYPRAVVEFKEVLRLSPAETRAKPLLAEALRGMNRPQDAEEVLKR